MDGGITQGGISNDIQVSGLNNWVDVDGIYSNGKDSECAVLPSHWKNTVRRDTSVSTKEIRRLYTFITTKIELISKYMQSCESRDWPEKIHG